MHNEIIINRKPFAAPTGLVVENYSAGNLERFRARPRGKHPVDELVIHETVTTSFETTVKVLQRRRLGVHFIIAANGLVTQHNDLALDRLAHAKPHNKRSVGIELINPYYPRYLEPGLPWGRVIDARWAHKKKYVLPTLEQAEACAKLILFLVSVDELSIPRAWVGLREGRLAMGRLLTGRLRKPGIWAHTYFGHADGAWPVLYSWLRLEEWLAAEDAYETAASLATGKVRRVNLVDAVSYR